MAARLNPRHSEMVREKIRASQLVNRLEEHVFGETDMSSTQVTAALGLLKKVVPDLGAQQVELANPEGETFKTEEVRRTIVDPRNTDA